MSDNLHGTEFGQSTARALNLISGELHGASGMSPAGHPVRTDPGVVGSPDAQGTGTMYSDQDPFYDGCSDRTKTMLRMSGTNIGNLLNAKHVTWGWFEGGFTPTSRTRGGSPGCGSAHDNIVGQTVLNYVGYGSFGTLAGSLNGMFTWHRPHFTRLILNPRTGEPLA